MHQCPAVHQCPQNSAVQDVLVFHTLLIIAGPSGHIIKLSLKYVLLFSINVLRLMGCQMQTAGLMLGGRGIQTLKCNNSWEAVHALLFHLISFPVLCTELL